MQKPRLLELVRNTIRAKQYSLTTERTYSFWIKRFILFHNKRHPKDMGAFEIGEFLTYLAVARNVSPSTQNIALCALIFLYKHVLDTEVGEIINIKMAKKQHRDPVVLSLNETQSLLQCFKGLPKLMASLCYGAGLRKMECHRLRVKDIDFDRNEITVRQGKGNKDRKVPLPHMPRHQTVNFYRVPR